MTAAILTSDFLAWLDARGMTHSDSPPVLWGQITLYDHEREVGLWPTAAAKREHEAGHRAP